MKYIILIISIIAISSCSKYEPQFEGATPLDEAVIPLDYSAPIVYAEDYLIGLTNTRFSSFETILTTNDKIVGMALNDNATRIAYKVFNENIRVIDLEGNEIKEILNSRFMVSFEYHVSGTLYMCGEFGQVKFDGTAIPIRSTDLNDYIDDATTFYGMAILDNATVYCLYYSATNNHIRQSLASTTKMTDEYFESNPLDLLFIRAYNYTPGDAAYNFYVRVDGQFIGRETWQHNTKRSQGFLSYTRQANNDIIMRKDINSSDGIVFNPNSRFYYMADSRKFDWPDFASRTNEIIFIDF